MTARQGSSSLRLIRWGVIVGAGLGIAGTAQATTPRWHPLAPAPGSNASAAATPAHGWGNHRRQLGANQAVEQRVEQNHWRTGAGSATALAHAAEVTSFRASKQATAPRRTGQDLQALIEGSSRQGNSVRVDLALREPRLMSVSLEAQAQIIDGSVSNSTEMTQAIAALIQSRGAIAYAAQLPIITAIEAAGGSVVYRCPVGYCLTAELPVSAIAPIP